MALFSNTETTSNEDRVAPAKYDARAGRWFILNRSNASGEWVTDQEEITSNFSAVMDLENIEVGWLLFASGQAPDIRVAPIGQMPPKPEGNKHKEGFRILMAMGAKCGGDLREFAATAKCVKLGVEELYTRYLAERAANPGKLPVVTMPKTIAVKSEGKDANGVKQSSTNYQPVFDIVKWVERPELLKGETASQATPQPTPAPVQKAAPADASGSEW